MGLHDFSKGKGVEIINLNEKNYLSCNNWVLFWALCKNEEDKKYTDTPHTHAHTHTHTHTHTCNMKMVPREDKK